MVVEPFEAAPAASEADDVAGQARGGARREPAPQGMRAELPDARLRTGGAKDLSDRTV